MSTIEQEKHQKVLKRKIDKSIKQQEKQKTETKIRNIFLSLCIHGRRPSY